jgi:hypothetical protein
MLTTGSAAPERVGGIPGLLTWQEQRMMEFLGTAWGTAATSVAALGTPAVALAFVKITKDLVIGILQHRERMAAIKEGGHVELPPRSWSR